MALLKINQRIPSFKHVKRFITNVQNISNDEYTATPQYPPILDLSYQKRLERKKEVFWEELKAVKTVEEKQIKLNMPKYYGFKCYMFLEDFVPYNNLELAQHITKTHLIEINDLPDFYSNIKVDDLAEKLQNDFEDILMIELEGYSRIHEVKEENLTEIEKENILTNSICKSINRLIINNLITQYPLYNNIQVDLNPRIESSWFAGGMLPPEIVRRLRKRMSWLKEFENEPTNRAIQYLGSPCLALRSEFPLQPIIPYSEAENNDFKIPYFKFDPRTVGITTNYRRLCNIPGFWPGETNQFGILSFNSRGYMLKRDFDDPKDNKEAIHRQGILASFAWLNAQANFLGFNTFNDITYPIVTQVAVTNGKLWSFYMYQLNTLLTHSKYVEENLKKNICWATSELKLFEKFENGKLEGFNPDVFKMLLKFYANLPVERENLNLRPFLNSEEKVIADYSDDDKRNWLEREYKFLVSNRPRHKPVYEIYHWEKIYKIDNKTRFMEKRTRPFELFQNPYNRKLNERQPFYVPKALRPDLPKHKGRWAKEYFP